MRRRPTHLVTRGLRGMPHRARTPDWQIPDRSATHTFEPRLWTDLPNDDGLTALALAEKHLEAHPEERGEGGEGGGGGGNPNPDPNPNPHLHRALTLSLTLSLSLSLTLTLTRGLGAHASRCRRSTRRRLTYSPTVSRHRPVTRASRGASSSTRRGRRVCRPELEPRTHRSICYSRAT